MSVVRIKNKFVPVHAVLHVLGHSRRRRRSQASIFKSNRFFLMSNLCDVTKKNLQPS